MSLMNALQQGALPPEVIQRLNQKLMAGLPPPLAYLEMVHDLVVESDALFFGGQPNAPRRAA